MAGGPGSSESGASQPFVHAVLRERDAQLLAQEHLPEGVYPPVTVAFPEGWIAIVVDQDREIDLRANLFQGRHQPCADTPVPKARIDVEVVVVCQSTFEIEFSVQQRVSRMKIDFDHRRHVDLQHLGSDSEAMCPQYAADEYLDVHGDLRLPCHR